MLWSPARDWTAHPASDGGFAIPFLSSAAMDSPTPPPPPPANDQSPPPPPPATTSGSPTDFLKGVVGKRVIVRLISGVDYRGARNPQFSISPLLTDCRVFVGVLSCLDGYMNIALEQTEEHVNGAVTNRYGDAFIRGNNGAFDSFISAY
jgi:U6 snRNA-associated Sm-like protein LSm6